MGDKSFINSVKECVDDCLYGFSKLHAGLQYYSLQKIIFDQNSCNKEKIAVVSGGGSGHEPFSPGYVGKGMLTASVSGSIFTSPPSKHILHAIRLSAEESKAVFLVIPNYTGDVLNFGLAKETALGEGISVDSVVVGEDIAQEVYGIPSKAGKRGTCGIILILKLAGYLSEMGENLDRIKKLTTEATKSMASLGLSLSSCSKPGIGMLWQLERDEMEIGVGVHGEAGVARLKLLPANEAVRLLLDFLVGYLKINEGDDVVALVNNLGSLTYLEVWLLSGELEKQLFQRNINVTRLYADTFFTSINMAGVQICLLKLRHEYKELFLEAFDCRTEAPAWPVTETFQRNSHISPAGSEEKAGGFWEVQKTFPEILSPEETYVIRQCLLAIAEDLIKAETKLNRLDSACGDGDCGSTLSLLGQKILSNITDNSFNFSSPACLFVDLSNIMQISIGGTSGALYGLFCRSISRELEKHENFRDACVYAKGWRAGIDGLKKYSTARLGDKTMLDPLETACDVFEKEIALLPGSGMDAFRIAVKAAEEACENTKFMRAVAGRASYTDESLHGNIDAGACAVVVWLAAILRTLESNSQSNVRRH